MTTTMDIDATQTTGWGVPAWSPGDAPEAPDLRRADLEKRLTQSRRQWQPVAFTVGGEVIPGVLTTELDRQSAVKLGYKLGIWAVFRIRKNSINPVFTGINSRMR